MTRVPLHAVRDDEPAPSVADRIRHLQAEAKQLAADHVREFAAKLAEVEAMASEIAAGGEVYAPGPREVARRVADDLSKASGTLTGVMKRSS